MERWQNKIAVVTGTSSGIGAAIFKDFAVAGLIVIGLDRNPDKVDELKRELTDEQQKRLHAIKCDVSSLESVNEAFDWIEKQFGGVDILVNNAATLKIGQLATLDTQLIQDVLQTNIMGVVYCTQRAFKSMKVRNFDGHVILINSIEGHGVHIARGLPRSNIYAATKYAITAMTEIYRQEFRGMDTKVRVTSISPGVVNTGIVPADVKERIGNDILSPNDLSQAVLYVIGTPAHVQVHELTIRPVGGNF